MSVFRHMLAAMIVAAAGFSPAIAQSTDGSGEGEAMAAAPVVTADVTEADTAPEAAVRAPQATTFVEIVVEGSVLTVEMREDEGGEVWFKADPIIAALKGKWETRDAMILITRHQDGARMLLDMADGKVRGNGVVLGKLPGWEPRETADTWLTVNAISVLTGTVASRDPDTGSYNLRLDDRLRPKFDLDLFVEGRRIVTTDAEPRSVGPVVLVPLVAVAEALGNTVERGPEADEVTVVRSQDSARLTINLATGLVTVNGVPRGVSPNMTFADADLLLLPFTAIETLTGTNISLPVGTSRIDVVLDDRLAAAAMPGESVRDEAEATPFTPERLDFVVGGAGNSTASFDSRWGGFNTRLRYETTANLSDPGGFDPSFLALEVRAQSGWAATLGDYNAQLGETQGVGVSRLRGVSWRKRRDDGSVTAMAAGTPLTGNTVNAAGDVRPAFGGFAAGYRRLAADGRSEWGVSAVGRADESRAVVAGWQKSFDLPRRETGLTSAFVGVEVGAFDDAAGSAADLRARGDLRYDFSRTTGVQASLSYDGAGFSRGASASRDPTDMEGIFNDDLSGGRVTGNVSVDWRSAQDWGVLTGPSAGARMSYTSAGDTSSMGLASSVSGRIKGADIDVSVDLGVSSAQTAGVRTQSNGLAVRAVRRFDWGNATASYNRSDSDGTASQRLVATVVGLPIERRFDKGVAVAVTPSATLVWSPEKTSTRAGVTASVTSGQVFGDKISVRGQFSALQSVDPENSGTSLFASATAGWNVWRGVVLEAGYVDDFANTQSFTLGLRGSLNFNPPRRHTRTEDGRGVLRGRVFLDSNRDGIMQDSEEGLRNVRVKLLGTRLSLVVDGQGYYTIQNLKEGLYSVGLDMRSLPLGYLLPDSLLARATIAEGRITTLDIPVIASGQVRGAVFMDANANGVLDAGEMRLEGALVQLQALDAAVQAGEAESQGESESESRGPQTLPEPVEIRAAAFGQYSFENLAPGRYRLSVIEGRKVIAETQIELTEDELFLVTPLAVGVEGDGGDMETVVLGTA